MTHTVFIDLDNHVATASATGTAAPDVPLKHLTKQTLAFAFHSGGTVSAVTGWTEGRVVVKATPTSDVLLLDTTLAATGSTTSTRYSAEWAAVDCDSAAMRTLIGASTEPLDVWAEIQWTDADGTYAVAFPIQILPTFNLPEDDPPDPTEAASWTWLKARLAAGSNITFTDNDTTQVRTIASSGAGGGGSGVDDGDYGDITVSSSGTVWTIDNSAVTNAKVATGIDAAKLADGTVSNAELQHLNGVTSALQTQLDNKQPLASALTTLASATAAGLALMDDADAAAQRTTLGLGSVNNTSDADKPVSTATQTALNLKQNTISGGALGSLFMNGGLGWTVVSKSTAIVNLFGALPSPVNQSYAIGYDGTNINWTAITDLLKSIGTQAQGGVLIRGASTWEFLPVGSSGQFLKSNGAGANPEWAAPAGGGDALTTSPLSQFAATTSAQLAGVISDETGSGALVFANSPTLVTPALGTPASGVLTNCTGLPVAGIAASTSTALGVGSIELGHASDTTIERSSAGNVTIEGNLIYRAGGSFVGMPVELQLACSDEATALTSGTAKLTFRMPHAMTLTAVRASVKTAPTGSTLVIDINEGGTSILGTKLSIDATEKTSTTAASAATITDSALADDAEITIDIDQIGSDVAGAGLKVTLIGTRA